MMAETDVLYIDGQRGRVREIHPNDSPTDEVPVVRPRPRPSYRRPSKKYETPQEMWAWHWVRMRIVAAWAGILTVSTVGASAGIVMLSDFTL